MFCTLRATILPTCLQPPFLEVANSLSPRKGLILSHFDASGNPNFHTGARKSVLKMHNF
jgi:hypothetical protein